MVDLINITGSVSFSSAEAWDVLKPALLFLLGMLVYSVFIFKFYRFIGKRDVFELNLKQYSKSTHPGLNRFLGELLYALEHIVLFPLFSFFWFGVFTVLLTFLSEDQVVQNMLLVSIALVAVIRVTAYYTEDLSKDLAKMLPFALLGVFLMNISSFSFGGSLEVIKQIPGMWKTMLYYLLFVVSLEFVLRIGHGFTKLFRK